MKIFSKLKNKYKSMPLAVKASIWFVFCTVLQKCISVITTPIFTRLMTTEQYGIYSTYLSWYSIITVLCTLEMHSCVYINDVVKADTEEQKNAGAIPLLSLSGTITFILFIFYLILHELLDQIIGLPTVLVCLIFAQVLFEPPVLFWSVKQRFEFKYVSMVIRTISMVVLNAVLGVIFVLLFDENQAVARVGSVVIIQVIFGVGFYIYFVRRAKKLFSFKGWGRALKVQLPLVPHGLSLTVLSSSDRIMINNLVGASEAGMYSVAYSAGYVVNAIKNGIADALRPWIYEKMKSKEYGQIRQKTKPIIVLVMLIVFAVIAFAPEIIYILAPSEYYEAIYVIPPVAASAFFTFLYNNFSSISFYYEKTKLIMVASIVAAVTNIVLNVICIPYFGYIAAGYTTMICYMLLAIAHYFIMRRVSKKELEGVKIFDIKFIIAMSVIVIGMTVVFSFAYQNIFVRYGIIAVIAIIAIVKRKTFINAIASLRRKK